MKAAEKAAKELGLGVEHYRDMKDYEENVNDQLYKVEVVMRAESVRKLSKLIENSNKSGEEKSKDLTEEQKRGIDIAVQLEKAIFILHGLVFHRDEELYVYLKDDQGKERKVRLRIEDAQ